MIAVLQAVTYTSFSNVFGGDWYALSRSILTLAAVSIFSILLLSLFPRIYFFRIWLRSIYLTIAEFEERIELFAAGGFDSSQLIFTHLIRMHDFTDSLSYKEHGFAARRISLTMVNIYTTIVALVNNVIQINIDDLQEIRKAFNKINLALAKNQQIQQISFNPTNNIHLIKLQKDLT